MTSQCFHFIHTLQDKQPIFSRMNAFGALDTNIAFYPRRRHIMLRSRIIQSDFGRSLSEITCRQSQNTHKSPRFQRKHILPD